MDAVSYPGSFSFGSYSVSTMPRKGGNSYGFGLSELTSIKVCMLLVLFLLLCGGMVVILFLWLGSAFSSGLGVKNK